MAVGQKQVEPAGWYISLFGSASWLDDVKTDYNYGDDFSNEVDTDVGFIVGGAVGTHLTDDVRVELEVAYSENDVDSISWSGSSETYDATGDFSFLTFMGNGMTSH